MAYIIAGMIDQIIVAIPMKPNMNDISEKRKIRNTNADGMRNNGAIVHRENEM